jgi:3-oxo-5-alpha-steroid 4-dehydrogenase 1
MSEELFNRIIIGWMILGVVVFFINLFIVAPYGRHASRKWGLLIDSRIAWPIMESPVLVLVVYFVLWNAASLTSVAWILAFLFIAHYVHRTFIFPLRIKGETKKMPINVILLAVVFNLFNGFFIGYYLGNFASYDNSWLLTVPFIVGAILFATGAYINWRSDVILFSLRDKEFNGYRIPRGFLFEKVSCPNHLGEIIEWSGYALMSFNLPGLSFALWTMANLIPRALAHHNWYKSYFTDYPARRKAIIPGIL